MRAKDVLKLIGALSYIGLAVVFFFRIRRDLVDIFLPPSAGPPTPSEDLWSLLLLLLVVSVLGALALALDAIGLLGPFERVMDRAMPSNRRAARKKANVLRRFAVERGWEYFEFGPDSDRFDVNQLPLLLTSAQLGFADHVLIGTWEGMDFTAFEYHVPGFGEYSGDVTYSCSITKKADAEFPRMLLGREDMGDRFRRAIGIHDIPLGDERFDRRFEVTADEEDFALLLLRDELRNWLLSESSSDFWFQTGGAWVLAYSAPLPPDQLVRLLRALKEFTDRFPRPVFEEYSTRGGGR